ncbi:MAG: putative lipid II flippase FtsW [Candidatus Moranbacteria bacterium]|nr:putative lipid II flippase FtsW [Candidatus Moranbacteria bacterium]
MAIKKIQTPTNTSQFDSKLLFAVCALLGIGLVAIASAGIFYAETRFNDDYFFFKRQLLFGILPGALSLYFFQRADYHRWQKVVVPLFLLNVILLILVFIPGIGGKIYGASRWVQIGPLSFQPSEMTKLVVILYLAAWFVGKGKEKVSDLFEGLVPFLAIFSVIAFLILKQPDTGTLGVIFLISMAIFFAAGARLSHLGMLLVGGMAVLGILIKLAPYRLQRFLVFLNPDLDPQGVGYHVSQALLAIGSGGFWGLGLGHSRQKFNYLPEPVTDSIFAIFSEEWGFIGALVVLSLFVFLAWRGFFIAKHAADDFGKLVAVGIVMWITTQAFINIAAISGLIPLTGIPLPFISYGGTSLVFLMSGVGILLNISRHATLKS